MKANPTNQPINTFNAQYFTDHKLVEGDIISLGLKRFKIGSVAGGAALENRCPIRDVERAIKFGHELHFVYGLGACLSAGGHRPDYGTKVAFGEDVYFAGRVFKFAPANNDNIKLVEVVYPEPDLG